MLREHQYALDIVQACDAIGRYVADFDRDTFLADDLRQSGVAFQFAMIGEAVRNLSDELKQRYPDVAWINARDLRNLIAHQYVAISWPIIWIQRRFPFRFCVRRSPRSSRQSSGIR